MMEIMEIMERQRDEISSLHKRVDLLRGGISKAILVYNQGCLTERELAIYKLLNGVLNDADELTRNATPTTQGE